MTNVKPKEVAALLKKRDPQYKAILIYGADEGGVREKSDILAKQVVPDFSDPFNFIELSDADLKNDPARLVDEAVALSFAGGERVVRVRGQSEAVTTSAKLLLNGFLAETITPNALTIIEAGALRKGAGLRKLFETSKHAAAIGVYEDNSIDIKTLINETLQQNKLTITSEAIVILGESLGGDRGVIRSELDKLVTYMGPSKGQELRVEVEHVSACLGASSSDQSMKIPSICASGKIADLSTTLFRATASGMTPITLLILMQRHFNRLYTAQSLVSSGTPPSAALKKLRPPVFFAEERDFLAQLQKWPMARLERALQQLLETEHEAKRTGAPQKELIERTALRLAAMAK